MIIPQRHHQSFIQTDTFLEISARINYLLSQNQLNHSALTDVLLGSFEASPHERFILKTAISCIQHGYLNKKRKLGPLAIIHPLRVAALMSHIMSCANLGEPPDILDFLCALLHDKQEDLVESKLSSEQFSKMEESYAELFDLLNAEQCKALKERIDDLTHSVISDGMNENQSYYEYLWWILEESRSKPGLLRVKLSDRIDNTLDTDIQRVSNPSFDFYRIVFDKFFTPLGVDVKISGHKGLPNPTTGALRLQQFYKNIVFLSLIRQKGLDRSDPTIRLLFQELAHISIRETQNLVLNIFSSENIDLRSQRAIFNESLEYCHRGGLDGVTSGSGVIGSVLDKDLDGSLTEIFSHALEQREKSRLKKLFDEPRKLAKMMLAFMGVFSAFIHDENYYLQGINGEGLEPYTKVEAH